MSQNPIPQGKYKPAVRHGDLIFTAGMTPRKNGVLLMSGKITRTVPWTTTGKRSFRRPPTRSPLRRTP